MASDRKEPEVTARDGTSQEGRVLPALDPGYVKVDGRTVEALIRFARDYGKGLTYYGDGLRGSFLIRKGVLGARDGAWLLRVERASYDVVLDRVPWGMSWVTRPWMEAPLCVDW